MKPFDYTRAHAPACAVRTVAADPGARYLAGGTNLVDHLKLGLAEPEHMVDVRSALDETVDPGYAVHSFGAQFAEAWVNDDTGEVRVRELPLTPDRFLTDPRP